MIFFDENIQGRIQVQIIFQHNMIQLCSTAHQLMVMFMIWLF